MFNRPQPPGHAITLNAKPSATYDAKVARAIELLREAEAKFSPLTQASSLGVEDMVITELIRQSGIRSAVFALDTGMLHAETMDTLERLQQHYGIAVEVFRPDPVEAANYLAANGHEAMYKSLELRKECCDIRKTRPLAKALSGKNGWLTGLRREQSNARADVGEIELQPERAKINPLVDWTLGDVWQFVKQHKVPYNPLHDQFFPSIGCAPCTRAVSLGEDFRAGRWWWEQESAKECGLHVDKSPASSVIAIKEVA